MASLDRLFEDNEELISNVVQISVEDTNASLENTEVRFSCSSTTVFRPTLSAEQSSTD
jgi:hypothetical protein